MRTWQLQQAKSRLSEIVKKATSEGPQHITVRGAPVAVIISEVEYERLQAPRPAFLQLMRASPWVGVELELERDPTLCREVDLG